MSGLNGALSLPPSWLIHGAVAAVWLYEGLWCKLCNGEPNQIRVVEAVPGYGAAFLKLLGVVETAVGMWILIGVAPILCAIVQTVLLVSLNACGLLFARRNIHDPAGMVVKNFAFLLLAWVSASLRTWPCP